MRSRILGAVGLAVVLWSGAPPSAATGVTDPGTADTVPTAAATTGRQADDDDATTWLEPVAGGAAVAGAAVTAWLLLRRRPAPAS